MGPPAIGKSTITQIFKKSFNNNLKIISRDDYVEDISKANGITYDDMFASPLTASDTKPSEKRFGKWVPTHKDFKNYFPFGAWENVQNANLEVNAKLQSEIEQAKTSKKKVVVIDMTNMNLRGRTLTLSKFSNEDFFKIAIDLFAGGNEKKNKFLTDNAVVRSLHLMSDVNSDGTAKEKNQIRPKTINAGVIQRLVSQYEKPTLEEGYRLILNSADHLDRLMKKIGQKVSDELENHRLTKSMKDKTVQWFITKANEEGFDKANLTNSEKTKIQEIKTILKGFGYIDEKPIDSFLKELKALYPVEYKNISFFNESILRNKRFN